MIKPNLKNSQYLSVFCVCMLFAAGCDKLKKAPATSQPTPPVQVQSSVPSPLVTVQKQMSAIKLPPAKSNQFDFSTKKDPFKPYVVAKVAIPATGRNTKLDSQLLPIHTFDISQFRLVGVVTDTKGNKAMVVDPTGKAYVLKVGMTIGKNEGKVTQIATSGVDVVEQFRDDNNKIRKETIRIPLLRKP